MASYLEARQHQGQWFVRMDDIDPPRVQAGAVDCILRCLERHGFEWDGPVIYQSQRAAAYHHALHQLSHRTIVYPCSCSRAQIARAARIGPDGPIYPGTCRNGATRPARSLRLNVDGVHTYWQDAVQSTQTCTLSATLGDMVLYRADGVFAYHLASAVDDATLGITHIVRGADLLLSSARQTHLLRILGASIPQYAHVPVVSNADGEKLSKQTNAEPLSNSNPASALLRALYFLGQAPPNELLGANIRSIWTWACTHWRLDKVPRLRQCCEPSASFTNRSMSAGN